MRSDIPQPYIDEAHKLDASGLVELFQITLLGGAGILRFTPYKEVTWQGQLWESIPSKLTETGTQVMGEATRPKFTLPNPEGVFSTYIHMGVLEGAIVVRNRVSPEDVENNINRFIRSTWRVSKILTLSKNLVSMELRTAMDGHNYKIPTDCYFPPDYPHVTLT